MKHDDDPLLSRPLGSPIRRLQDKPAVSPTTQGSITRSADGRLSTSIAHDKPMSGPDFDMIQRDIAKQLP